MKKRLCALLLLSVLSACANREIAKNPDGSDKMRLSPCACLQLDWREEGYRWLS